MLNKWSYFDKKLSLHSFFCFWFIVTETQGEDSSSELEILLGPTSPIPQEIEACADSLQEIDEDVITSLKNAEETLKTTVKGIQNIVCDSN